MHRSWVCCRTSESEVFAKVTSMFPRIPETSDYEKHLLVHGACTVHILILLPPPTRFTELTVKCALLEVNHIG